MTSGGDARGPRVLLLSIDQKDRTTKEGASADDVAVGKQKKVLVCSTDEHRRTRVADKEQTKIMSLFYLAHCWFAGSLCESPLARPARKTGRTGHLTDGRAQSNPEDQHTLAGLRVLRHWRSDAVDLCEDSLAAFFDGELVHDV